MSSMNVFKQRRLVLASAIAGCTSALLSPSIFAKNALQRPLRIYMILYRGETPVEQGFRDYFTSRGVPVELIVRDVAQDVSKVAGLVAEARALKVDLVYTWGTPVTLAVVGKHGKADPAINITDIPVVFTMVASPEGSGLVASRASSTRNITGTSHVVPVDQQLSAMRAYRGFKKIAVIFNPTEPNSVLNVKDLRNAATREGFKLIETPIPLDDQKKPLESSLPTLIAEIARKKPDYLYLGPDSFVGANRKPITEAALEHGLPVFSATEVALREGKALFGLVSRYDNVGRLTAYKAEQILVRKTRPSDIPIETLNRFSYIVNMSVATELGVYPPLKVVNYAEIIR